MMRRSFDISATIAIVAVNAVLVLGAADVHSLLHQWQDLGLAAAAHDDHHPEPVHLDHGSIDVPCPACLGLSGQGRLTTNLSPLDRPEEPDPLTVATSSTGVADLSYRLPLSRAPPVS